MSNSVDIFNQSKKYMPGGVNSPVRAFGNIDSAPIVFDHGKGSKLYDVDQKEYIDYCCSWGALIHGHANKQVVEAIEKTVKKGTSFGANCPLELDLAKRVVVNVRSIEKVRFVNSGTEAVMSAIRLARGFTKRKKIIKFDGCYHGHADHLLVQAGSGLAIFDESSSEGVPDDFIKHTISIPFNDKQALAETFKTHGSDIAAIIVEPVPANMGIVLPQDDFLISLRSICDKYESLLIFDEVITGFRLGLGGAQEYFDVLPDITTLGKIIGGGMPVGAYGARTEIMDMVSPCGPVYQAGTLSGNPVSMSAGSTTLQILEERKPYKDLENMTLHLCQEIRKISKKNNAKLLVNSCGSMWSLHFIDKVAVNFKDTLLQDQGLFSKLYSGVLDSGIYLSPSPFETNFLSTSHVDKDIEAILNIIDTVCKERICRS